jgi:hypothetical protein
MICIVQSIGVCYKRGEGKSSPQTLQNPLRAGFCIYARHVRVFAFVLTN